MDFVPDCKSACEAIKLSDMFSRYSKAYVITNEDLRESMGFMPKKCNRALTVAASGDHPLFASLYGAKHVDTFDISYNAKCIMDIKVAALSFMRCDTYKNLLDDLYWINDIQKVPKIKKILQKLPITEFNYLCNMKGHMLFSHGLEPLSFHEKQFPTKQEYKKIRKFVKKPYNFIMTDIGNLSDHLTETYDFIHLSNVLDYVPMFKITNTITPLLKHVNVGGRILMLDENRLIHEQNYGFQYGPTCAYSCETVVRIFKGWRFIKANNCINILERLR